MTAPAGLGETGWNGVTLEYWAGLTMAQATHLRRLILNQKPLLQNVSIYLSD